MVFTHFFDLVAKLFCVICIGIGYAWVTDAFSLSFDWRAFALALGMGGAIWFYIARPVSSWLYVRLRLGVGLAWSEAVLVSVLLSPIRDMGRWVPMLHLRKLDRTARRRALLSEARKLVRYYSGRDAQWKAAPIQARVLRVLLWFGLVAATALAFSELPPFSWLNSIYPELMQGGLDLLVNTVLASLPFALALESLERRNGIDSARFTGWTRVRQVNTRESKDASDANGTEGRQMPKGG